MEKYKSIYKIEKNAIDHTYQLKLVEKKLENIEKNINELRLYMIQNDIRNIKINNYII